LRAAALPLCVVLCVFLLGPALAAASSPAAGALLRGAASHAQLLALTLALRLRWPPGLLLAFGWTRALTSDALDLAAPECAFGFGDDYAWSYERAARAVLGAAAAAMGALALAHAAATLALCRIALKDPPPPPLDALAAGSCADEEVETARWRRCDAVKHVAMFSLPFVYVFVIGTLLQSWDCAPVPPDGAPRLRADPATLCGSARHARFARFAAVALALLAPGVPLACALWLRRLRRGALAQHATFRPAWRGLADPATRTAWGVLYQSVRHHMRATRIMHPSDATLMPLFLSAQYRYVPCGYANSAAEEQLSAPRRLRRAFSAAVSPHWESLSLLQKGCLLASTHALRGGAGAQAAAHAAIYAAGGALLALTWPFQRLDVHIPLAAWAPALPRRWQPQPGAAAAAVSPAGWRALPRGCGWLWRSHVRLSDALNWGAMGTNASLFVCVLVAMRAPGNAGAPSPGVDLFLTGLNALQLKLAAAAWVATVAAARAQVRELARLRAARARARHSDGAVAQADDYGRMLLAADSAAAAQSASAAAALRRRHRRSEGGGGGDSFTNGAASARTSMHEALLLQPPGSPTQAGASDGSGGGAAAGAAAAGAAGAAVGAYAGAPAWLSDLDNPALLAPLSDGSASASASSPPPRASRSSSRPRRCSVARRVSVAPFHDVGLLSEEEAEAEEEERVDDVADDGLEAGPAEEEDAQQAAGRRRGCVGWARGGGGETSVKAVRQTIKAAGAKLALLRATGRAAAAASLCRAVDASCCAALARLQRERAAALRCGAAAPALAAAAEAQMNRLEQLFFENGFESALLDDDPFAAAAITPPAIGIGAPAAAASKGDAGLSPPLPLSQQQHAAEARGVPGGAAVAAALLALCAASLCVGLGFSTALVAPASVFPAASSDALLLRGSSNATLTLRGIDPATFALPAVANAIASAMGVRADDDALRVYVTDVPITAQLRLTGSTAQSPLPAAASAALAGALRASLALDATQLTVGEATAALAVLRVPVAIRGLSDDAPRAAAITAALNSSSGGDMGQAVAAAMASYGVTSVAAAAPPVASAVLLIRLAAAAPDEMRTAAAALAAATESGALAAALQREGVRAAAVVLGAPPEGSAQTQDSDTASPVASSAAVGNGTRHKG
jgi:hypothetical protein